MADVLMMVETVRIVLFVMMAEIVEFVWIDEDYELHSRSDFASNLQPDHFFYPIPYALSPLLLNPVHADTCLPRRSSLERRRDTRNLPFIVFQAKPVTGLNKTTAATGMVSPIKAVVIISIPSSSYCPR